MTNQVAQSSEHNACENKTPPDQSREFNGRKRRGIGEVKAKGTNLGTHVHTGSKSTQHKAGSKHAFDTLNQNKKAATTDAFEK